MAVARGEREPLGDELVDAARLRPRDEPAKRGRRIDSRGRGTCGEIVDELRETLLGLRGESGGAHVRPRIAESLPRTREAPAQRGGRGVAAHHSVKPIDDAGVPILRADPLRDGPTSGALRRPGRGRGELDLAEPAHETGLQTLAVEDRGLVLSEQRVAGGERIGLGQRSGEAGEHPFADAARLGDDDPFGILDPRARGEQDLRAGGELEDRRAAGIARWGDTTRDAFAERESGDEPRHPHVAFRRERGDRVRMGAGPGRRGRVISGQ